MIVVLILVLLLLLTMMGRRSAPGWKALEGWNYAHRGLHDEALPENSLGAFQAAVERGYGAELDVHLLKDGQLAVLHDSSLKRITGQDGIIEELTAQELHSYHLCGTAETIPLFSQVLEVFGGKTPLIVEIKVHGDNYAAVTDAACKLLDGYRGAYCLESFDPRVIRWLRQNRPQLIRGQLTENYFRSKPASPKVLWLLLTHQLLNFLTRPDFVAYRFSDRKTPSNWIARRIWGIRGVAWTLQTPQDYETAVKEGWIPIFENFQP